MEAAHGRRSLYPCPSPVLYRPLLTHSEPSNSGMNLPLSPRSPQTPDLSGKKGSDVTDAEA